MPTRYRHPGRPTEFNRFLELSKIAWDPVLELLGKEVRFEELDAKPYEFKPALGIHQQIMEYEIDERTKREEYRWLSAGDIVRVHDEMIRVFGGEAGILDSGRLNRHGPRTAFRRLGVRRLPDDPSQGGFTDA